MKKHITLVLISLLALPVLASTEEEKKQPKRDLGEGKFYQGMTPFSLIGFEPKFEVEVADPSVLVGTGHVWKVYFKDGRVARRERIDLGTRGKRHLTWGEDYYYDDGGRLFKILRYSGGVKLSDSFVVTKRDSKGRPLTVTRTNEAKGELQRTYSYTYDDEGRMSQAAAMAPTDTVVCKVAFHYDEKGELSELVLSKPGYEDKTFTGRRMAVLLFIGFGG